MPVDRGVRGAAADSAVGKWISYDKWKTFQGKASLYSASYSYFDGLSVAMTIKYQTRTPDNDTGNSNLSFWTTLTTIAVTEDTQVRYGEGDQVGVQHNVAILANPWAAHEAIRFLYYWAPVSADTVEITSIYSPVE